MATSAVYVPQTKVDWRSKDAIQQFRIWRKEVERILGGPMDGQSAKVMLNHVYIWAGGEAETLVEAKEAENPSIDLETPAKLLDCLQSCLEHSTYFREARDQFYNLKQKPEENTTSYYSRIMELYKSAEFPTGSNFLIVDRLIHGCTNKKCKEKLMSEKKDVTVNRCLEILRQYEAVKTTMQRIDGEDSKVNATYSRSRDPTRYSQRNGGKQQRKQSSHAPSAQATVKKKCFWCGEDRHKKENCPAKDTRCNFCGKKATLKKLAR